MTQFITLQPCKTYKTAANAHAAVEKKYPAATTRTDDGPLRYILMTHTDGRFFPVFIGINACFYGVHFNFNVLA